jgi:hypothetical protein
MPEVASLEGFYESFPMFNKTALSFKELIGDQNRSVLEPVGNINDINQGSIFNSLYWHVQHGKLAIQSMNFSQAEGVYLDKWGELFGISRPSGFDDKSYLGFIVGRILAVVGAVPTIASILEGVDCKIYTGYEIGFFADVSATDIETVDPSDTDPLSGGTPTFENNTIYILVPNIALLTRAILSQLESIKSAGYEIFFGTYTKNT